jgi:hypothetical protein
MSSLEWKRSLKEVLEVSGKAKRFRSSGGGAVKKFAAPNTSRSAARFARVDYRDIFLVFDLIKPF